MHGVVVGSVWGFDITAHPDTIIHSYVLFPSGMIKKVRQDHMMLVDLHSKLPFGVLRPLSELKKKKNGQLGLYIRMGGVEEIKCKGGGSQDSGMDARLEGVL